MRSLSSGETRAITTPSRSMSAPSIVVVGGKIAPDDDEFVGAEEADLCGDGAGRRRVVAGDHGHADPGTPAGGECVGRARDAAGPRGRRGRAGSTPARRRQREAGGGAPSSGRLATASTRRPRSARAWSASTAPSGTEQRGSTASGAPFTRTRSPATTDMRRRRASNGNRARSGGFPQIGVLVDPDPVGERVERRLHRIAEGDPVAVLLDGAPGAAAAPRRAPPPRSAAAAADGSQRMSADRFVAGPVDHRSPGRHPDLDDGHLVAGERAGLVGADEGRGPERLDRLEVAHERVAGGHALGADRQRQRDGGQQPARARRRR